MRYIIVIYPAGNNNDLYPERYSVALYFIAVDAFLATKLCDRTLTSQSMMGVDKG